MSRMPPAPDLLPSSLLPAAAGHPLVRATGPLFPRITPDPARPEVRLAATDDGRRAATLTWPDRPLRADLTVETFPELGVIRLSGEVRHTGPAGTAPVRVVGLQMLDVAFGLAEFGPPTIHHMAAGPLRGGFPPTAFAPRRTTLPTGPERSSLRLSSAGRDLPMMRVSDTADSAGLMAGVDWPGSWRLDLSVDPGGPGEGPRLRLAAGPVGVDVLLEPGESLPVPGAFVGFWTGSATRGADLLRRYLRTLRATPRAVPVVRTLFPAFGNAVTAADVSAAFAAAKAAGAGGVVIDGGWAAGIGRGRDEGPSACGFRPDPARFPDGLRPLADAARQAGLAFGAAVDPERIHTSAPAVAADPERFLIPGDADPSIYSGMAAPDFGRADVREWLLGELDALIAGAGLTWLRLDSGLDPAPILASADEPGRSGASELRHAAGLAALWTELRRRHPELVVEFGPAGGRRLHAGLFAVADVFRVGWGREDPAALRRMLFGAADFLPPDRLTAEAADPKAFLAAAAVPSLGGRWADPAAWKTLAALHRRFGKFLGGDVYAVTADPAAPGDADGRQYHDSATGGGLVLYAAAARPASAAPVRLTGLSADASYHLHNPLAGADVYRTGRMLADEGLSPAEPPFAGPWTVIEYRPVNGMMSAEG
jgi:alpha-galactosidase